MKKYSRRDFVKLTGFTVISSGFILMPSPADAFWPWVVRFILRSSIRRGVTRTAGRAVSGSLGRGVVSNGVLRGSVSRSATKRAYRKVVSYGVTGGVSLSVSPNVFAQMEEYDAKAIWINTGVDNEFDLHMENNSSEIRSSNLWYRLVDVPSGREEIRNYCGLLYSRPNDSFSFSFKIKDLPYTGVKRLEAIPDSPDLHCQPSENIVVARSDEVMFDES